MQHNFDSPNQAALLDLARLLNESFRRSPRTTRDQQEKAQNRVRKLLGDECADALENIDYPVPYPAWKSFFIPCALVRQDQIVLYAMINKNKVHSDDLKVLRKYFTVRHTARTFSQVL